jgi:hypothetical protein
LVFPAYDEAGANRMITLTEAQRKTLEKISFDHLAMQLVNGALVVAFDEFYVDPSIMDVDGQLYLLSDYLAIKHRQN